MTATLSAAETAETTATTTRAADEVAAPAAGRVTVMAVALWAVVGSLLAYGIAMTVIKASALFG